MERNRVEHAIQVDKESLFWLLVVHGTFVASGLMLAIMDRGAERHATPR